MLQIEETFLSSIKDWLRLGANIIGGCCRVDPGMIAKIKDKVQEELWEALEYRQQHEEKAPGRNDWASIEKNFRRKETTKKFKKSREGEADDVQAEITSPLDFGPIVCVPGLMSREAAEKQLLAACQFLEVPMDPNFNSNKHPDDRNNSLE